MKTMKRVFMRMRLILFILITICVIASNATADNVTYTYDDAGRLTKANYGKGRAITYTYDKAGNIIEKKVTATADPILDIKANGSDGSVTSTGNISVTVALDPGSHSGENVDWWVAVDTPFGWFYFDVGIMNWAFAGSSHTALSPTHQGSLFDLSTFEVLNRSIPVGTYTFYFAVDTNMNGVLDFGELFFDSVVVNITP